LTNGLTAGTGGFNLEIVGGGMPRASALVRISVVATLFCAGRIATADTYPVIVMGTVTMEDGSPPPFSVAIERVCVPRLGDAPGPVTNKKGEWVWRIDVDAFASRYCVFRASHTGYVSTTIDASNLNLETHDTTLKLPPLVIAAVTADPYTIRLAGDDIPGRAKVPFGKAIKAIDARNYDEAILDLQASVAAVPKFADGWHAMGVVYDTKQMMAEARDAYSHAIEADPKQLPSYVTLARLCIKTKDWQCALEKADGLIKLDTKHTYPEIYIHRAVAQYQLKDLAAAQESAQEAIRLDAKHKWPRAEYVLGRVLEAKGDINAAREHMQKYLELEPTAKDAEDVQTHLLGLGKPEKAGTEPELEPL
jgi:Tfp pilus assembly protein PilF